jgi:hypothetical protein
MNFRKKIMAKYKIHALALGKQGPRWAGTPEAKPTLGNFVIPKKIEKYVKVSGGFPNVKNWKAQVMLCNSGNTEVGEWEDVGYVGFEPKKGTLIPIARSDEHHTGHDYLHDLMDKKMIPKGEYTTIWVLSGTNYAHNKEHTEELIPVYKRWLELGGPNLRISTRVQGQGDRYMSFEELVKGGAGKPHKRGTLTKYGKELVSLLEKAAILYKKAITTQKLRPPLKALSDSIFDLAKFVEDHRTVLFVGDSDKIKEAASDIILKRCFRYQYLVLIKNGWMLEMGKCRK